MIDVKWVVNQSGTRSHAFVSSSSASLCNQAILPPDGHTNPIEMQPSSVPYCGTCSRLFATLERQDSSRDESMLVDGYLEQATQLVIGPSWTYAELATLPTWKESVDRVATALANERRSALVQRRVSTSTVDGAE